MKAVHLSSFGDPDVLKIIDVPKPVPSDKEVLVRVHAAGINFFEVLMRQNRYAVTPELPMIFGVEVAGVVEAMGSKVESLRIGERVAVPMFAIGMSSGGYAEYIVADALSVVGIPEALSFEDANALMIQGLTALHLTRRIPLEGKNVLISAAAGGVGTLLIQLAKQGGANLIITTASSQDKLNLARVLGADITIDTSENAWTEKLQAATNGAGADIIYDMVGRDFTAAYLQALAPGGTLVFGALGRFELSSQQVEKIFFQNQTLTGFAMLRLLNPTNLHSDLANLFNQAANGLLKVIQGGSFPLEQAAEAHRMIESRQTTGKINLIP